MAMNGGAAANAMEAQAQQQQQPEPPQRVDHGDARKFKTCLVAALIFMAFSSFMFEIIVINSKWIPLQFFGASLAVGLSIFSFVLIWVNYVARGIVKGQLSTKVLVYHFFLAENGMRVWHSPTIVESVTFLCSIAHICTASFDLSVRMHGRKLAPDFTAFAVAYASTVFLNVTMLWFYGVLGS
ncbi:hypothetical protein ABFS83_04G229400 [Erythranthe nasuta]